MTRVRNSRNKISITRKLLVCNGHCTESYSDVAAEVSSVPLKQWAVGPVQAFHDLTSSLYSSSMTQYLHQRSHPHAGLLPRARILVSREGDYEL